MSDTGAVRSPITQIPQESTAVIWSPKVSPNASLLAHMCQTRSDKETHTCEIIWKQITLKKFGSTRIH